MTRLSRARTARAFFPLGLSDHFAEQGHGYAEVFSLSARAAKPPHADNVIFDQYMRAEISDAFHPACFEVYKTGFHAATCAR